MKFTRWTNPMLPQTLHIATFLFYISAVFDVLYGLAFTPIGLVLTAAKVASGLGIANGVRWGYQLAVVTSALGAALAVWLLVQAGLGPALINVIFPVALFALVIHPMSRDYQKIWFE